MRIAVIWRCSAAKAAMGLIESTVSRILGHKAIAGTIAVSGIYDRFDRLPEIRSALIAWTTYIETLVVGDEKRGEIVAFGRRSAPSKRGHGAGPRVPAGP